jgi:branched-subunit amino acid transport protein
VWLTIAGMAIATYLTRAPLLLALSRRPLPPRVRLWLRLVPLAVLPALAAPLVLAGAGASALAHPPLWGAAAVLVLAARRVNLLVTVAAGVAVVAVLRAVA